MHYWIFQNKFSFIVWDLATKPPTERDIRGRQMAPPLHQPPKYEEELHLDKDRWPDKDYTYSVSNIINMLLYSRTIDSIVKSWIHHNCLILNYADPDVPCPEFICTNMLYLTSDPP